MKSSQDKKRFLSRSVRLLRENLKRYCTSFVGSIFRSRSFRVFGVPSGLTSEELSKKTLYPERHLKCSPPKSIEVSLFWKFRSPPGGMHLLEEGILTLPNAMATHLGGNLSQTGKLVTTFLQTIDGKRPHQHDLFRFSSKRFFPRVLKVDEPVITLAAGWQDAFYHWMYEVLPRLHLIEKGGYSLKRVYAQAHTSFQKQSLELLGIGSERLINAAEYQGVQTPQLIVPSIPHTPTRWGCAFLREKMLPHLSSKSPCRLYISRSDATKRRIINEEEVFGVLEKYGFIRAELSRLTFKEQMELFHSAEIVVGPHGAGFSHLVFCQPGIPVLEIFSPAYTHRCYWQVCDRIGLDYFYLFGEGKRYPDFVDSPFDPDIEVDLNKLKASLRLMEIHPCHP